jgi:Transport protein Avl9
LIVFIDIQTENFTFEFRDPNLERSAGLTPADRKWMDDIVRDVNDGWNEDDPARPINMQYVALQLFGLAVY